MTRITHKQQQDNNISNNDENVDTQLELLKYATQVQSRIKEDITSDFTLCKLGEQDKEGVTNMTVNAYLARRQLKQIQNKAQWHTFNQTSGWITERPNNKLQLIELKGKEAFDMYMTKVIMTAVLNRNVEKNHLIQFLKNQQEEPQEPEPTTNEKVKHKIVKEDKNKPDNQ